MSVVLAPPVLAVLVFVLSLLFLFPNEKLEDFRKTIVRLSFLVVIIRLCLPVSSLANDFVYDHFFAEKILHAKDELTLVSVELDKLKDVTLPELDGFLGTIENSAVFLNQKALEFKNALVATAENMGALIENLLQLTFLYVGIFVFQVLFFPFLAFWILLKMANSLTV